MRRPAESVPPSWELPGFLEAHRVSRPRYSRWLRTTAAAHLRRDRKRNNKSGTIAAYRKALHDAVRSSAGYDDYTGERLRWDLLDAREDRRSPRAGAKEKRLRMRPAVDRVGDPTGRPLFRICAWQTSDAKNDFTLRKFVTLCRKIVAHSMT